MTRPYRWELPEPEIAREYRDGIGMESLADIYKVSPPTIRACLVRQGASIRTQNTERKLLPASIAAEYRIHGSLAKVAALHGVDPKTVKRCLIEMGARIKSPGGPNNPTGKSGRRIAGQPKKRKHG